MIYQHEMFNYWSSHEYKDTLWVVYIANTTNYVYTYTGSWSFNFKNDIFSL